MRGDAQNIDLSENNMWRLLEQTDCIEKLLFTGGEPFINFNGMVRFLSIMLQMRVDLYHLDILTNGCYCDNNIVQFLNSVSEYIDMCLKSRNRNRDEYISLVISDDIYHKELFDASKTLEYYKKAFADNPKITVSSTHMGNVAFKYGRALLLKDAFDRENKPPVQCEIMTKDSIPAYPLNKWRKLDKDYQKYILAPIYFSANGDVFYEESMRHEYVIMDADDKSKICTSENNNRILESIEKFNQGKMHYLPWFLGDYARKQTEDYKERKKHDSHLEYSDRKMELLNSVSDEITERESQMERYNYDVNALLKQWQQYKHDHHEDEFGNKVIAYGNEVQI